MPDQIRNLLPELAISGPPDLLLWSLSSLVECCYLPTVDLGLDLAVCLTMDFRIDRLH